MNLLPCVLGFAFALPCARAQDGGVDLRFAIGKGASDDVYAVASLPAPGSGFLIAGHFTDFDGHERWRMARLHGDGSLDESFDPKDGPGSAPVSRVVALPDGGCLAAGSFFQFDGRPRRLVVRLNPDGTVDPAFNANGAFGPLGGTVQALERLADGSIVMAGRFDPAQRGGKSKGVVRLKEDGTADEAFTAGIRVEDEGQIVNALVPLPDGKMIVAGSFRPAGNVARLEATGAIDPTFHLAQEKGIADALIVQLDGKILVAFTDGDHRWLARFLPDGATDADFHAEPLPATDESRIESLALQADGCILVGGTFHAWAGVRRDGLARLKPDGSLDRTFDPGACIAVLPYDDPGETPDATVHAILPLPDGRLLIAGRFDLYNGAPCRNLARVLNGPH